jgi:C1A family cysteine protease
MPSRSYVCHRDTPDPRDHQRTAPVVTDRPPVFDLRHLCPPVYNQGQLGSCSANALAAAVEVDLRAAQRPHWMPSRLYIYYNERARQNTVATDSGARLRDGVKGLTKLGVCPEAMWAYDVSKFALKPDEACYADGRRNLVVKYGRVAQSAEAVEPMLYSGKPVLFGFIAFSGFESKRTARTGALKLPGPREKKLGGHAVLCVGYDQTNKRFLIRNSWGVGWGLSGYFWMPYDYFCNPNLAFDFWVIDTFVDG